MFDKMCALYFTMYLFAVDSKRRSPKETKVNLKYLKLIWGLHQTVADEHIRSASYLLQYKSYTSSFTARPMISNVEPVPTSSSSSPESHIPLSERMKKRRAPAIFEKSASVAGEAKKSK